MDTISLASSPPPTTPSSGRPVADRPRPLLAMRMLRAVGWLLAAAALGATLGAVARLWMRLLADEPDFSWSGTIAIVAVFAFAGAGHAVARLARRAGRRRWSTAGRVAGAVLTLGLFVAAGSIMFPTVAGGSLALWRRDWQRWARVGAAAIAVPAPAVVMAGAVWTGVTPGRAVGLVLFVATYGVIVWALRPVAAPVADDWRLPRWLRIVAVVAGLVMANAAILLTAGLVLNPDAF